MNPTLCMNGCGNVHRSGSFFCSHECAMNWAEMAAPRRPLVVLPEMKI